jgi:hypothetical protein
MKQKFNQISIGGVPGVREKITVVKGTTGEYLREIHEQ